MWQWCWLEHIFDSYAKTPSLNSHVNVFLCGLKAVFLHVLQQPFSRHAEGWQGPDKDKRGRIVSRRLTNACKVCSMQKTLEIGARLAWPSQPSPGDIPGWCVRRIPTEIQTLSSHQEPGGSEISTQPKLYHPGATHPHRKCKCTTHVRIEQMKRKSVPFPEIYPPYTCGFWLKKKQKLNMFPSYWSGSAGWKHGEGN